MADAPRQVPSHLRSPHGAASVHLDALRGVAAVGVCLNHLRDFSFQDYWKLDHHNFLLAVMYLATGLGHQWVIVFFVLSGYLVGGSVLRSMALDHWSWRSYLLKRLTRLYTVLIPALLLGGILDMAGIRLFGTTGIYGGHNDTHELVFPVSSHLRLPILAGNYAFLQGIYLPTFGSNGPLWSLSSEFWYYIAFPFIVCALWPRQSFPKRLLNGILLLAIVLFMRPPTALLGLTWLMGVAIHYLPRARAENALVLWLLPLAAAFACGATLAWSKWSKQAQGPIADCVLGVAVTILIYAILTCSRTPMPKPYQWTSHVLSRSSYTLYLVHVPLLVFLTAWIAQAQWIPTPTHVLEGCAIFMVVMIYAQVVWFFFEKRTDVIRARIKPLVMGALRHSIETESRRKAITSA